MGSGKTGTFVIGSLALVDPAQTNEVVKALGNYLGVKSHLSIGGTHVIEDKKKLGEGPQIVIGTPEELPIYLKEKFWFLHI